MWSRPFEYHATRHGQRGPAVDRPYLDLYGDRVLALDLQAARRWGVLGAVLGNQSPDLMIAATALEHGLTIVTRNVAHFQPAGVSVLNPFTSA